MFHSNERMLSSQGKVQVGRNSKGRAISDPALYAGILFNQQYYFFLRLLLAAANPAKPVPKRSIVAGSGTGAIVLKSSTENPSPSVEAFQVMVSI